MKDDSTETQRVDAVVKERFASLGRKFVDEAIESGLVIGADGNRLKKGDRLPPTEIQTRRLSEQLESLARGDKSLRLKIVGEDPDVIVVDKPAGVACFPKSLFDTKTLTHWAIARSPGVAKEFPDPQPTLTPYSIETEVSGLVLVAKHAKGFALWKERYEKPAITFSYLAWCWGDPKPHRFFISTQIAHPKGDNVKWLVVSPEVAFEPPAREAITVVRVAERHKRPGQLGFFLAEIQMASHVEHQVRLHLAHQGFPVMGDRLYDPEFESRAPQVSSLQLRLFELEHAGQRAKTSAEAFKTSSPLGHAKS